MAVSPTPLTTRRLIPFRDAYRATADTSRRLRILATVRRLGGAAALEALSYLLASR